MKHNRGVKMSVYLSVGSKIATKYGTFNIPVDEKDQVEAKNPISFIIHESRRVLANSTKSGSATDKTALKVSRINPFS